MIAFHRESIEIGRKAALAFYADLPRDKPFSAELVEITLLDVWDDVERNIPLEVFDEAQLPNLQTMAGDAFVLLLSDLYEGKVAA